VQNFLRQVLDYFNLNARADVGFEEQYSHRYGPQAEIPGAGHHLPPMPLWEQAVLYLATAVGVIFSSAVLGFKTGKPQVLDLSLYTIVVSLIIALILMPYAFQKLGAQTDAPMIARLGLFVEHGAFWPVLLTVIGRVL